MFFAHLLYVFAAVHAASVAHACVDVHPEELSVDMHDGAYVLVGLCGDVKTNESERATKLGAVGQGA